MEQVEYLEEYVEEYPNVIPQILNNTDIEEFLPVNEDDSFDLLPVNTNFDEFIEEDPLVKRYRNDFQRNSHAKKNEEMTTFNDQKGTFRHIESADSSTHKESYKNLITYNQSSKRIESAAKVISCKTIDTSAIRNRSFPFNTIPLTASIHATRKPNLIQVTKTNKFSGQHRPKSLFGSYTKLNLNRSIDSSLNRIVAVKKSGNNLIGKLKQPVLHSTANIFGSFNEKIIKYKQENPGLFPVKEPEIPKPVQKITAKPSLQSVFINKFNRSLNFKEKNCPMYKPNLNIKKFSRYASKSMSSLEMSSELLDKDNSSSIDDEIDGSVVVEEEIVKTNNEDQNDDSDKDSFDGLVETLNEYIDDEANNDQIVESLDSIDKCDINIQPQQTIKLDIQPNIIDQGTHYIKLDESPILRKPIKNFGRNKNLLHNDTTYESIKNKPVHSNDKSETLRNKNEKVDLDSNRRNYSEQTKPSIKESRKIPRKKVETFVNKKVPETKKDNELANNKPIIISDIKLPVKSNNSGRKNILNLDLTSQEQALNHEMQKIEFLNKIIAETLEESSVDESSTILEEICQIEEELNVTKEVEAIKSSFSQKHKLEDNSEITIEYCSENVEEISLTAKEINNLNKLEDDEIQMNTLEIEVENTKIDDNEDSNINKNEAVEEMCNEEESSIINEMKKDELSDIVDIVIKDCNKNIEIDKSNDSDSVQIPESELQESVLSISENLNQPEILSEVQGSTITTLNDNSNSEMPTMDSIDNEQKDDNLDDVDEIDNILAEIDSVMESIHSDEHKPKEGEILNSALSETSQISSEKESAKNLDILKELDTVMISSTLIDSRNIEDTNDIIKVSENSSQISHLANNTSLEGFSNINDNSLNIEDKSIQKLDENLLPELTKSSKDDTCKTITESSKAIDLDNESKTDKPDKEYSKVSDAVKEIFKIRKNSDDSSKSNINKKPSKVEDEKTTISGESFKSNDFDKEYSNVVEISSLKSKDSNKELFKSEESKENDLDKKVSPTEKDNKDSLKLKESLTDTFTSNFDKQSLKPSDHDKEVTKMTDIIEDSSKSENAHKEYLFEKLDISKESAKVTDTVQKVLRFSPKTKALRAKFDTITKIAKVVLLKTDKIPTIIKQNFASTQQCAKVQNESKNSAKNKGSPIQNISVRTRKQSKDQTDLDKSKSGNEIKKESDIKTRSRNRNSASKINTDSKEIKTEIGKSNIKSEVTRQSIKSEKSNTQINRKTSVESNSEVRFNKVNSDTELLTEINPKVKNDKSIKQINKKSSIASNTETKNNEVNLEIDLLTENNSEFKNNVKNDKLAKENNKKSSIESNAGTKTKKVNADTQLSENNAEFKIDNSIKQINKKSSIASNTETKTDKVNVEAELLTENNSEIKNNAKNDKSAKQINKKSPIASNVETKTDKVNVETELLTENNSEIKNNAKNDKSAKQINKRSSIESNTDIKTNKVSAETDQLIENSAEIKIDKSIKQMNKKSLIASNAEAKTNEVNIETELSIENNPEIKNSAKNEKSVKINKKSSIESNTEVKTNKMRAETELLIGNSPDVKIDKSIKHINKRSSVTSNAETKTNEVNVETELSIENNPEIKNNAKNDKSAKQINKKSSIESNTEIKTNKVSAETDKLMENSTEVKIDKSIKQINKKSSIESNTEIKINKKSAETDQLIENSPEVNTDVKTNKVNTDTELLTLNNTEVENNVNPEKSIQHIKKSSIEINLEEQANKPNTDIKVSTKEINKKASIESKHEVKTNKINIDAEQGAGNNPEVKNNVKHEKSVKHIKKSSLERDLDLKINKVNIDIKVTTENNPEVINKVNEKFVKEINKKPPVESNAEVKTNKANADGELLKENNLEVPTDKPIKQMNKKSSLESNLEVKTNEVNTDKELLTENNTEVKNKKTVDIMDTLSNEIEETSKNLQNSDNSNKNKSVIETDLSNIVEPDNNKKISLEKLDNVTTRLTKTKAIVSKISGTKASRKNYDTEQTMLADCDNLKEHEKNQTNNFEIGTIPLENQETLENTLKLQETKQTIAENSQETSNSDKTILNHEHLKESPKIEERESSMRKTRMSTSSEIKEKCSDGLSDYEVESIMAKKIEFNKKGDFPMSSFIGTRLERKRLLESCNSESSGSDKTDITSIKSPSMERYSKRKRIDSKLNLNTSNKEIDLIKDKTLEQSVTYLENVFDKSNTEKINTSKEIDLNSTVKLHQTRSTEKAKEIQNLNLESRKTRNDSKEKSINLSQSKSETSLNKDVSEKKEVNQTHDKYTRSKRSKGNDVSQTLTPTDIHIHEPLVRKSISLRNKIVQIETRNNSRTKKSQNKNKNEEKQNKLENKNTSISSPQATNIISDFAYPEILSSTPNESPSRITPRRLRRPYNNVTMLASALNESMLIPKSEKRRERRAAALATKSDNLSKNTNKDAKDMMAPNRPCARIIRRRQSNLIQISRKEYEKVLRENIYKKEKQNQTKNKNLLKSQGIFKNLKIKLKRLSLRSIKKLLQPDVKEQKEQSDTSLKQLRGKEQKRQSEIISRQPNVEEPLGHSETILKQPSPKEQKQQSETILKHIETPKSTSEDKVVTRKDSRQKSLDEIKTLKETVEVNVRERRKVKGKKSEESINNSQELETSATIESVTEQKEHTEIILQQIESPKSTPEDKVVTRKDSRRKSLDEIKTSNETVDVNVKEKRKIKGKKSEEIIKISQEPEIPTTIDSNKSVEQSEDVSDNSIHGRAESIPKENEEEKPQLQNKQPANLEKPKKGLISIVPLNDRVSRRDTMRRSEEYSKRLTRARSMPRNLANIEKEIEDSFGISKNNARSIIHLNKEYENDNAVGLSILSETPIPANEDNDNLDKNDHRLKSKTFIPTPTTINENLDNQLHKDFQGAFADQFASNQNLRLRNRISRGGHKIKSDEKTIESIIMAHIISRENSKESSNSPQNNRKAPKLKPVPQLSGNKIEQLEETNIYPQKSVAQSGPVSNPTLEKSWLANNEKKLIESEIELQQEKSKEKILTPSSTKSDSVFVSTIVPLDQLKSTKGNVPTLNQHLPANQQSKQNQTKVKTTIIQPPTQVKLLPAHVVVETVFMTREEYDRKNLKKIITPPAPLSLTAQVQQQKIQNKVTTSTDSSVSNCPASSRANVQNVAAHFRDVDSIMNKICDLLELQIKSESRLNLNESEEQRRKIQRYNNISKMKLNSENALQVLIFLQNYFFNVTTPESYAKQQARQQQLLNNTLNSSPSLSEPLSSSSSSTSSSRLELQNSASNDSEKCFSFKRIRLQKQPEQQDSTQPQKQHKSAQNSKGTNKRSAETSLSDIQSPSKMLRSSEKLLQSNSSNLNSQLNFPITGGITQKEPEDILPDFLNILAPQIKEEVPDETI